MPLFEIPYLVLLTLLSVYGAHRAWLVIELTIREWILRRSGGESGETGESLAGSPSTTDQILIQLPVYNDGMVFLRLLDSVPGIEEAPERFEIQVLDDSDDGSSVPIAAKIETLRARGFAIEHLQREVRTGYKAGALAEGLLRSDAPFVALFDSDFVIPPDFFRRLLPEFADEGVAFVQARWGFANASENFLTKIQALMLDGHFAIEHRVRSLAGRFFNFNGTAGIWRRAAIDDAGGWRSDSITEDLDLSLRAWLAGWRSIYRDDVVAYSDLPTGMRAYRTQQNRWISGSIQIAATILPRILAAPAPLHRRLDILLGVTGNLCYPLIVILAFALPHAIAIRLAVRDRLLLHADVPFFCFATGSVALFYWRARRGRSTWTTLARIPALMALGLGMTLHNSRAVLRGVTGGATVFERTPKRGGEPAGSRPRQGPQILPWLELALLVYLCSIGLYAVQVAVFSLPLVGLLAIGTGVVLFHRR